jgi:antirestriction protein ArdC
VTRLMTSETYISALHFRAKFHRYSMHNVWLIFTQYPTATQVAGYHTWLGLGRYVKKGETGISILAPLVRKTKDDEGNEHIYISGFKTATVFDIAQTEGQDIPQLPAAKLLEDNSLEIQLLLGKTQLYARSKGFTLSKADLDRAHGFYNVAKKQIVIKEGLAPLQHLKTLLHELAHALFEHSTKQYRPTVELEAESCAFLVCDALGLDTSSFSFAYLANWADEPMQILPAAERACKVADEILLNLATTLDLARAA